MLSCSYIKPQLVVLMAICVWSCMLSCSYIKPQPTALCGYSRCVVCYHVPTSNHNSLGSLANEPLLYVIMFLHQTTTRPRRNRTFAKLYVIMFLHQTTTQTSTVGIRLSCMLSCSYIKPQPKVSKLLTISKKQSISLIRNGCVGNKTMQIY